MPATNSNSVLALDVGGQRIGLALASQIARLPHALTTLTNDISFVSQLKEIVSNENVDTIVVGWPRGLNGQQTAQTELVQAFANDLRQQFPGIQLELQDEALTSKKAEAELQQRGKAYQKTDVDALAAVYILEDWLAAQPLAGEVS